MRVLAFDQSSHTGWAAWDGASPQPSFGVHDCMFWGIEDGAMIERFRRWLGQMLDEHQPEAMACEGASIGGHADAPTIFRQAFLVGMISWAAHLKQIPLYRVPPASWRKSFIGFGTRGKRIDVNWKKLSIARCKALGWDVKGDDNKADALGILDHVLHTELNLLTPWRRVADHWLPLPEIAA